MKFVPRFAIRFAGLQQVKMSDYNLTGTGLKGQEIKAVEEMYYEDHMDQLDKASLLLENSNGRFTENPLFFEGNIFSLYMGYGSGVKFMNDFQITRINSRWDGKDVVEIVGEELAVLLKNSNLVENEEGKLVPASVVYTTDVVQGVLGEGKGGTDTSTELPDTFAPRDSAVVKTIVERNMRMARKQGFPAPFSRYYIMKTEQQFDDFSPYFSTKKKWTQKADKSDWKMITEIAKRWGYSAFVRERVFFFMLPRLSESPMLNLGYKTGNYALKSFRPKLQTRDVVGESKSWIADDKEVKIASVKPDELSKEIIRKPKQNSNVQGTPNVSELWERSMTPSLELQSEANRVVIPFEERDKESLKSNSVSGNDETYTIWLGISP